MKFSQLTALAFLSAAAQPSFAAYYAGIDIGSIFVKSENRITVSNRDGAIKRNDGIDGVSLGGYFGAGFYYERYYLGAEFFGKLYSAFNDTHNSLFGQPHSSQVKQNLRFSDGMRLMPGFALTESLLAFGSIGYSQLGSHINAHDAMVEALSGSHWLFFNGWELGLGLEAMLTDCFSMRLFSTYAFYGAKSYSSHSSNLHNTVKVKMDPTSNDVTLGVSMRF